MSDKGYVYFMTNTNNKALYIGVTSDLLNVFYNIKTINMKDLLINITVQNLYIMKNVMI